VLEDALVGVDFDRSDQIGFSVAVAEYQRVSSSNAPRFFSSQHLPDFRTVPEDYTQTMGKRPAENSTDWGDALKSGERPLKTGNGEEVEFEDEFEDEYESEAEVFEAGVDGRPDEEREADERRGTWNTP